MPTRKHNKKVETKRRLTRHFVESVRPPTEGQRLEIYDTGTPGLILRITRSGSKSFAFWYRDRTTSEKRVITLGRYPKVRYGNAKILAKQALADVLYGTPPLNTTPHYWKNQLELERSLFPIVWERYWTEHLCKNHLRSRFEVKRMVEKDVRSEWADIPVRHITASDWKVIKSQVEARGSLQAATNLFRALRTFFRWCAREELIEANPLASQSVPTPQQVRERYLTDVELSTYWIATAEPSLFHNFLRLSILTGARRQELAGARWGEFDLKDGYWTVPAARSKNKREIKRPLSDVAVKLLKAMRAHRSGDYIFPAKRAGKYPYISGFAELKNDFDTLTGLEGWRLHDLRRTITTHLAEAGVLPHITDAILGHRKKGLEGVYNLAQYRTEVRKALNAWAAHLEHLGEATADLFRASEGVIERA